MSDTGTTDEDTATEAAEAVEELDENEEQMAAEKDPGAELEENESALAGAADAIDSPTSVDGADLEGPTVGFEDQGPTWGSGMVSSGGKLGADNPNVIAFAERAGLSPGGTLEFYNDGWGDKIAYKSPDGTITEYDEAGGTVTTYNADGTTSERPMTQDDRNDLQPPVEPITPNEDTASQEDGLTDADAVTQWVERTTGLDVDGDGTVDNQPAPPPPSAEDGLPPGVGDDYVVNPYAEETHPAEEDEVLGQPDPETVNPSPEATGGGEDPNPTPQPGVADPPDPEGGEGGGSIDDLDEIPTIDEGVSYPSPEGESEPGGMGEFLDPTEHQGTLGPDFLGSNGGGGSPREHAGEFEMYDVPGRGSEAGEGAVEEVHYEGEAIEAITPDPVDDSLGEEPPPEMREADVSDIDFDADLGDPGRGRGGDDFDVD